MKTIGEKFEPYPKFYYGSKKRTNPEGNWAPLTLTAPLRVEVGERAAE